MKTTYIIQLSPTKIAIADLMEHEGTWWLNRINVPVGFRGRGIDSALLDQVLAAADAEGVVLRLQINPCGDLSLDDLRAWYERRGFTRRDAGWFERPPAAQKLSGSTESSFQEVLR